MATATNGNTILIQSKRKDNFFRPGSAICYVEYKNKSGTGAIYGWETPEEAMKTLFITSSELLEVKTAEEVTGLTLIFEDKTIGKVSVTPDWVKFLWTSPRDQLAVTVIELGPAALIVLSRTRLSRLIPATQIECGKVTFFHYQAGDQYGGQNYGIGEIHNIASDIIKFNVSVGTEVGSLGFPVLNLEMKAVAVFVEVIETSSKQATYKASNIQSILEAFKAEILCKFGNQTESDLWKKRIEQISIDDLHLIGAGAYGNVYKFKDSNSSIKNTELALKIVGGFGGLNGYENQIRSLEKEYKLVKQLDIHPRIIQFFALIRDDNKARIMIIMEYLKAGSLADKMKDHMPLANEIVLKYVIQLLEGLDFLHQRNVYHSDIKPANILFTAEDNLKICDFGIAVDSQTTSSSSSSHLKGDFHYMSPERIKGASRDAANDIWGVGATFVEMITGRRLNHQDNQAMVILNLSNYILYIDGKPLNEFIALLDENDYKKNIVLRTLCQKENRANAQELSQFCTYFSKSNLTMYVKIKIVES